MGCKCCFKSLEMNASTPSKDHIQYSIMNLVLLARNIRTYLLIIWPWGMTIDACLIFLVFQDIKINPLRKSSNTTPKTTRNQYHGILQDSHAFLV